MKYRMIFTRVLMVSFLAITGLWVDCANAASRKKPDTETAVVEAAKSLVNPTADPVHPSVDEKIRKEELLGHIKFLSSKELRGREAGTEDQRKAADYIAEEFKRYGLAPYGEKNEKGEKEDSRSYFQIFHLPVLRGFSDKTAFELKIDDQVVDAKTKRDFAPLPMANKLVSAKDASVVFAGYGILSPEHEYDDFKDLDLTGKWALLLRYEPGDKDPKSTFDGKKQTKHASFTSKVTNCSFRHAAGVLIVTGPVGREKEKEKLITNARRMMGDYKIPVFMITRAMANRMLKSSGKTVTELQTAIDKDLSFQSFECKGVSLSGTLEVLNDAGETRNIIGRLEGRDEVLKKEVVVIGAHCDHVGLGNFGSLAGRKGKGKIHPGADDNASGTSGLLEVAQYFSSLKGDQRPKRSILFMAFSGEEKGLLGSKYYVKNPMVPLKDTVAMLNMDMIGRSSSGAVQVAGIGTAKEFPKLTMKYKDTPGLKISYSASGVAPSDNTSFFQKNIPVLFFFTGTHPDYHRPTDTWEKINAPAAAGIATLASKLLFEIADTEQRPTFIKADKKGFLGVGADRKKVATAKGFPVGSVVAGGPAEKAGLKAGDLIAVLNGRTLNSARDLPHGLISFSPGDEVTMGIIRGEETLEIKLKLGVRGKKAKRSKKKRTPKAKAKPVKKVAKTKKDQSDKVDVKKVKVVEPSKALKAEGEGNPSDKKVNAKKEDSKK